MNPVRWEYQTIKFSAQGWWIGGDVDTSEMDRSLNYLGSEGWELVSIFDTNSTQGKSRFIVAVLKRPI